MVPILLVLPDNGPRWERVYRALRGEILEGHRGVGTRLPATRALAAELGYSRNTVEAAYDQLRAEGFIESRAGAGSYVAEGAVAQEVMTGRVVREAMASSGARLSRYGASASTFEPPSMHTRLRYDFRYGLPDTELAGSGVWLRTLATSARLTSSADGADAAFGYGATEGWLPLRHEIQAHLARSRGVHCDVEQILIVSGSQQGLDLSARLLLDPGDVVVTEDPQYLGAREVFRSLGAKLQPVAVDDEGMLTPGVPAKLAYVTPSHQFPTGAVLSLRRRLALLAWADRHDAYVIEDDYDSEFRYDGAPLRAIHGLQVSDRVIYLGTFSKVLFPSLRLGYVVVPHSLLPAYRGAKWLSDRHSATLEQRALAAFMEGGHFERMVRVSRTRYAERRDALLEGLVHVRGKPFEVSGAATGLHVLARMPGMSRGDLGRLIRLAADRGVGVYPAEPYYLNPADAPAALLFGFATITPDAIREGLTLLHEAYRCL